MDIVESIFPANKAIHSIVLEKLKSMIAKLDIKKAYNMVSWIFLVQTLDKMGFSKECFERIYFLISLDFLFQSMVPYADFSNMPGDLGKVILFFLFFLSWWLNP